MIDSLNKYKNILPKQVILEVLKEQLEDIYIKEKEVIAKLYQKSIIYKRLSNGMKKVLTTSYYYVDNLNQYYINFKNAISNFNLTDDDIKELYRFGKSKRQELGLSDNLFNIFEVFILEDEKIYERANQKIKNINNF